MIHVAGTNGKGSTVAYLRAIIRDVMARYPVDRRRVFVVGHSNGGFMAYRMACEASDLVTGVVSLAGATWKDPARCRPENGRRHSRCRR